MSAVARFFTLYLRNVRQFPRIPTVLVFGLVMPVVQLLLFGNVFRSIENTPAFLAYEAALGHDIDYIGFIAPAIILLTAFLGMANSSAALLVDVRTGYFDKLRTTPAAPGQVVTARLLAEMTRVSAQAVIIMSLALLMGARVQTGVAGAAAIVVMAVVFSALTTGLIVTALAMKTKSDQATQSAFPLFFIFIFLSTAYVPIEGLPGWLQDVVAYNPADYLIQGLRALMLDGWGAAAGDLAVAAGAGAVIAALLVLLNVRVYRRLVE